MKHIPNRWFVAHAEDVPHLLHDDQKCKAERGYCWCLVDSECMCVGSMHKRRAIAERWATRWNPRFRAYEMRGNELRWWIKDWETGRFVSKHRTWYEANREAQRLIAKYGPALIKPN